MKHGFDHVSIEVVAGDIASQKDVEAVVNAANAQLLPGGGVAGALHRGAGPGLAEECRPLAPIRPGQAVITGAHDLPNQFVIHCLGPVYGKDQPSDTLLSECYRNALRLAEDKEIRSIAFPSISTGVFGFPLAEAARIALSTAVAEAAQLRHLRTIRFVLFGAEALAVHEEILSQLASGNS
jgi:O-acetyl-ADP-ribose deacetylase (regulator of RNase III)